MVRSLLVLIINFYRKCLSPLKLQTCRFYPTCSEYAVESLKRFGVVKGIFKSTKRILKCHPFHQGGYDPVGNTDDHRWESQMSTENEICDHL